MRILVVDDERWIRKGIVKMIQKEDLGIEEIIEADGAKSGWEAFQSYTPELVISDVKFPVDNGCILCKKIYEEQPKTKIIMLSGYGEFQYVKSALQYRAIDYLLKPVDKTLLNDTIKQGILAYEKQNIEEVTENQEKIIQNKNASTSLKSKDLIQEVMKDIEEHYHQKITLSDLADKYYINETYLSNLFTKIAGISLMNYLMEVRVEKAKTLLMITKMSITDIAYRVGYENARYFTRVFKKVTGETPKEYRLGLQQELYEES